MYDQTRGDSSRWEQEGTNYEKDRLPYLVSGYAELVQEARREAGLQPAELASELGVPESDLTAVEQGRAARAGIGGSLIRALEERLDVELVEE
jgi:ribosome-binding protein aMBF1 (putative translation factor)